MPDPKGPDRVGAALHEPDLDGTVSWRDLLAETEARLSAAGLPAREARWIVDEASGAASTAELDGPASARGVAHLDAMVERRLGGEPLQYVLGRWAFRTLDLMVDRRVLIPRPETEVVAGLALLEVDRRAAGGHEGGRSGGGVGDGPVLVADLGTGSGAIGLSIAAERTRSQVWCVDVSTDAVAVARANCAGLGRPAQRVVVSEGSWFDGLPGDLAGRLDVVVSNPPYVAPDEVLPDEVAHWEPNMALFSPGDGSPGDGTADLRTLVDGAPAWLAPGGALVLEMAPDQTEAMVAHAEMAGYVDVAVHPDLAGRDRALVARRPT